MVHCFTSSQKYVGLDVLSNQAWAATVFQLKSLSKLTILMQMSTNKHGGARMYYTQYVLCFL